MGEEGEQLTISRHEAEHDPRNQPFWGANPKILFFGDFYQKGKSLGHSG